MAASELLEVRASSSSTFACRAQGALRLERSGAVLAVGALTVLGLLLRVLVARQSPFGDELSTYWISATHGLGNVISLLYGSNRIHHAEITPPLYFVAAWLTTQFGHSFILLRLPSLIAGCLSIPVCYLLGMRTVGRWAALLGTALVTLAPFEIYYSTEARAYGVMTMLVLVSTLAMLLAIDTRRVGWWIVYAASSCAAVYAHLTSVFVLSVQLLWLLWTHPEHRRAAALASLGTLAGLVPWAVGFANDLSSPTVKILSALSPFNAHEIPIVLGHWAIGYPYANSVGLAQLPGRTALVLLALATVIAGAVGAKRLAGPSKWSWSGRLGSRAVLIGALALACPIGEAVMSTFSTHVFGVRNLAASWPALALSFALLMFGAGPRLRVATVSLAALSFAIGAQRMLVKAYERPDYQAAASYISQRAAPTDVVIDETGEISPGPLTPLDVLLRRPLRIFRAGSPAERDHPFGFADPIVPLPRAVTGAVAAAHGARVFVVSTESPPSDIAQLQQRTESRTPHLPRPYRLVAQHVYPGIARVLVQLYAPGARTRG